MSEYPTRAFIDVGDVPKRVSEPLEGNNGHVPVIENTPWGSSESGVAEEDNKPGRHGDKMQENGKPGEDRISSQAGLAALRGMIGGNSPQKY